MQKVGKRIVYFMCAITMLCFFVICGYLLLDVRVEVPQIEIEQIIDKLPTDFDPGDIDLPSDFLPDDTDIPSGDTDGGGGGGIDSSDGLPSYWFRWRTPVEYPNETVYFRTKSLGEYTGRGEHGFVAESAYYLTEEMLSPLNYFANALSISSAQKVKIEIELGVEKAELLPYYPYQRFDSDTGRLQYAMDTYLYSYSSATIDGISELNDLSTVYGQQELAYRQYVKSTYLKIDPVLKSFLLQKGNNAGILSTDDALVSKIAQFIMSSADYDIDWLNKNYPSNDMVRYFFEVQEGVCRHYAATATMMFRAYGIPARYALGYAVPPTNGEWYEWETFQAGHAWVEIYFDGLGWVPVEVTGANNIPDDTQNSNQDSAEGGMGGGNIPADIPRDIIVVSKSKMQTYDGNVLSYPEFDIIGDLTDRYEVVVTSYVGITDVGKKDNIIRVEVFDILTGEVASNVSVAYQYGSLVVTPRQALVVTGSQTASIKDVSSLSCYTYVASNLVTGDQMSLTFNATLYGVGYVQNTVDVYSVQIVDKNNKDVTKNYSLSFEYGYLILT